VILNGFPGREREIGGRPRNRHTARWSGDYANDAHPGRGRRRDTSSAHGRDDGDLAKSWSRFPEAAGSKVTGDPHRLGAFVGLSNDMAEELGFVVSAGRARALKSFDEMAAALWQLRQSARRHRRLHADLAARVVKSLIDDPNIGMSVHFVSINTARCRAKLQTRAWKAPTKPKSWSRSATPGRCRPEVTEAVRPKPRGVRRSSGPHDARGRALYPGMGDCWRDSARAIRPNRSKTCPKLRQGREPEWLRQEGCCRGRHTLCPAGDLASPPMRREQSPSASAIPWC